MAFGPGSRQTWEGDASSRRACHIAADFDRTRGPPQSCRCGLQSGMPGCASVVFIALLACAVVPSADLKWKLVTVDRSRTGYWKANIAVPEAGPANTLTRAAFKAMRRDALRRMDRFLNNARSEAAGPARERGLYFCEQPTVLIGKPDLLSIVIESSVM